MFRHRLTLPLLLLLTLIGGALRFTALDRPTIWGDEAATYGRVAGTYADLLDQLSDSAFPPLHYETLWWIHAGLPYWGKVVPREGTPPEQHLNTWQPTKFLVPGGIPLTPFFMRLIPAIAGTLFIPAIFFLARQLFGPRVSLLTAFFACFSAYLLVYSRDGKMYMPFWLFGVLNVGCLLWWLRVRRPIPWLLWVASGIAMIGWHASGGALLGIGAVIFFTSPRLYWRKLVTLGGFGLWSIAILPAYGYERLRRRKEWPERLRWDRFVTWPRRTWRHFRWPAVIFYAIGLLIILSTMFGPLGFYSSFDNVYQRVSDDNRPTVQAGMIGIDWVMRYNAGRELPGYLLYTASAYLTGWEWPRHLPNLGLDDQRMVYPRTLRLLEAGTTALLVLLAIGLVPWRRAFSRAWARLERMRQERFVCTAYRGRRLLWLAIWLTAVPWVMYTQSAMRPPNILDGFARIVLKDPPSPRWPRARVVDVPEADSLKAAISSRYDLTKQAWTEIARAWPAEWKTYTDAFHAGNYDPIGIALLCIVVLFLLTLSIWKWRRVGRGAIALVTVTLALLIIGTPLALLPKWFVGDLWMPRYVGTVFPAFLILVAVLVARQPTRWMAPLTMCLFVIVNMGQFGARVFGHSEPPLDKVAADVIAAQPQAIIARNPATNPFRAYTDFNINSIAEPGGSMIFNVAGRYYLHLLSGFTDRGRQVRQGPFESNLNIWRYSNPGTIARDLERSPQITSFVVWSAVPPFEIDQTDAVGEKLEGLFRKVSDETWPVADHWRWVQHPQVRRRAYERLPVPTAAPATAPAAKAGARTPGQLNQPK